VDTRSDPTLNPQPSSQLCFPKENRMHIEGSCSSSSGEDKVDFPQWVVTADIIYFEDDTEDGELDLRVVYPTAIRALTLCR
jgi:hypothetical protein